MGVSDFFVEYEKETRIRALDHLLSSKECAKIFKDDKSCVIILLTAVYEYGPKEFPCKAAFPRLHIVPYSGHCNHIELKQFVAALRPHAIFPIVKPRSPRPCSLIPASIYDLCGRQAAEEEVQEEEAAAAAPAPDCSEPLIIDENHLPVVLIPRLRSLPSSASAFLQQTSRNSQPKTATATATGSCESEAAETAHLVSVSISLHAPNITESARSGRPQRTWSHVQNTSEEPPPPTTTTAAEKDGGGESGRFFSSGSSSSDGETVGNVAEDAPLSPEDRSEELFCDSDSSVDRRLAEMTAADAGGCDKNDDEDDECNLHGNGAADARNVDASPGFTDCSAAEEPASPSLLEMPNEKRCGGSSDSGAIREQNAAVEDDPQTGIDTRHLIPRAARRVTFLLPNEERCCRKRSFAAAEIDFQDDDPLSRRGERAGPLESILPSESSSPPPSPSPPSLDQTSAVSFVSATGSHIRAQVLKKPSLSSPPTSCRSRVFSSQEEDQEDNEEEEEEEEVIAGSIENVVVLQSVVPPTESNSLGDIPASSSNFDRPLFELDEHFANDRRRENEALLPGAASSSSSSSAQNTAAGVAAEKAALNSHHHSPKRVYHQDDETSARLNDASSDSDDCQIVAEYNRGAANRDNFLNCGEHTRMAKKLKIDQAAYCDPFSKKNERFVNAILLHYFKTHDWKDDILSYDQCSYFNNCHLFSHSAYRL